MAKNKSICVSVEWEEPRRQEQKLCDGEGASLSAGLSASVPMYGEDPWMDGRYKGYGPSPHRKTEKPV